MEPTIKQILHTADGIKDKPMEPEVQLDGLKNFTLPNGDVFDLTDSTVMLQIFKDAYAHDGLQAEIKRLEAHVELLRDTRDSMVTKIAALESSLTEAQAALSAAKDETHDAIFGLTRRIVEVGTERDDARVKVAALEQQVREIAGERDEWKAKQEESFAFYEDERHQLDAMRVERDGLRQQLSVAIEHFCDDHRGMKVPIVDNLVLDNTTCPICLQEMVTEAQQREAALNDDEINLLLRALRLADIGGFLSSPSQIILLNGAVEALAAKLNSLKRTAPVCSHDRLNEDGQCRACGSDCRGIGAACPPASRGGRT